MAERRNKKQRPRPATIEITRQQLIDVITVWERAAQHDPTEHTFATPEAKGEYLWQLLTQSRANFDGGRVWGELAEAQRLDHVDL